MIPPLPTRPLRLNPSILNRQPPPNSLLTHRHPKQPPPITHPRPQLLARIPHAIVLPFQLALLRCEYLPSVQQVGAVDGPVAEGA